MNALAHVRDGEDVAVGTAAADNRVVARASGELTVAQWEALIEQARSGGATR